LATDNLKDSTIAKLASKTAEYYDNAFDSAMASGAFPQV